MGREGGYERICEGKYEQNMVYKTLKLLRKREKNVVWDGIGLKCG